MNAITVKQLIEKLQAQNPDALVIIFDDETGQPRPVVDTTVIGAEDAEQYQYGFTGDAVAIDLGA